MELTDESIRGVAKDFKEDEIPRREAISKISASFKILKDNCRDLPTDEGGFECLAFAREAEERWKESMRG